MNTERNKRHRQIEVRGIEVDEGISELLTALWDLRFKTQFSCEGEPNACTSLTGGPGPGVAYVLFPKLEHAFAFVQGSIGLLGHCAFYEGGIHLKPLEPTGMISTTRGSVRFSPLLLGELSQHWTSFAAQPPRQAFRSPTEIANYISATRPLASFEPRRA